MSQKKRPEGAFLLWKWGDREIDDPKNLREQLIKIHSKGFSGVLATLGASRYEFIDRKVVRAIAQASQWSKKRHIAFWFQADPRQASRTFITKTGERTQNLIVARRPEDGLSRKNINIVKIVNNRFDLRYEIPRVRYSNRFREVSLQFEPCELEKVFLFQMEDSTIINDSIRDITSAGRFFTNIAEGYTEVFGEVEIPPNEEWYCIAFPKFTTNLYDFAGRESNDMLLLFVEDLFDACTYLDGFTWGEGEVGYVVDTGRFPVSLSIYNTFLIEYQYDLREHLYGLILPVDDKSHIKIRNDYYQLLLNIVFDAQRDFYQMIHSFFEGLDVGIHHTWHFGSNQVNDLVRGSIDPWQNMEQTNSTFIDMEKVKNAGIRIDSFISTLVITKSLGIYSETRRAFLNVLEINGEQKELLFWTDLMGLFSVQWLANFDVNGELNEGKNTKGKNYPTDLNQDFYEKLNRRIDKIKRITGFQFPTANIALIYPIETIMSIGSQKAEKIVLSVNKLISRLTMGGIQLDVISPTLLKKGKPSSEGVRIMSQTYDSILFPYPEVLNPRVLEVINIIQKYSIPVLFGGCAPQVTTSGKRIHREFPIAFNPDEKDLSSLLDRGVKPILSGPRNGLTSIIYTGEDQLLLLCPKIPGSTIEGDVLYRDISFYVPESSTLVIFKVKKNGSVEQVL